MVITCLLLNLQTYTQELELYTKIANISSELSFIKNIHTDFYRTSKPHGRPGFQVNKMHTYRVKTSCIIESPHFTFISMRKDSEAPQIVYAVPEHLMGYLIYETSCYKGYGSVTAAQPGKHLLTLKSHTDPIKIYEVNTLFCHDNQPWEVPYNKHFKPNMECSSKSEKTGTSKSITYIGTGDEDDNPKGWGGSGGR